MAELYSLVMQKLKSTEVVDLVDDFGIVLTEMPMLESADVKEVEENDWIDEDGVEVYDADTVRLDAYEIDVQMAAKGFATPEACHKAFSKLLKYLTTGGTLMKMYSPIAGIGRTNVRFMGVSNAPVSTRCITPEGESYLLEWGMKFKVGDPITEVMQIFDNTLYDSTTDGIIVEAAISTSNGIIHGDTADVKIGTTFSVNLKFRLVTGNEFVIPLKWNVNESGKKISYDSDGLVVSTKKLDKSIYSVGDTIDLIYSISGVYGTEFYSTTKGISINVVE